MIVPTAGATLRDGAVLDATATGLSPIKSVTFELSGNGVADHVVGTANLTLYGWIAKLDLTSVASGTYTLQSVATDGTEAPATSAGVSVAVVNAPPVTTVLQPTAGAQLVGGGTWLGASATGQHSISKVQFEISGGSVSDQVIATGVPTAYGYLTAFDSSNFPNGTYTIRSVATDSQGLTGTSAPVSITIANVPLTTSVIVPTAGATLRDGAVLDATATGLSPIKSVTFELSGNGVADHVVGTANLTLYGWIAKLDLTSVASGTYTLQSVATDGTEAPATSAGVSVSVVGGS